MLEVSFITVNQLHSSPSPRALVRRLGGLWGQGRGRPTPFPCSRAVGAAVLAAAIFTLAVLAGPHLIEHLLGKDGDSDHCAVCAAIHGARAGAPTAPVLLVPALLLVGPSTVQHQSKVPALTISASASRGPPLAG
jgi:hypothetical protein